MANEMSIDLDQPNKLKTWGCKIGEFPNGKLPMACDYPMRQAVSKAYKEITGHEPNFIFSGWGEELTEGEREALENTESSQKG